MTWIEMKSKEREGERKREEELLSSVSVLSTVPLLCCSQRSSAQGGDKDTTKWQLRTKNIHIYEDKYKNTQSICMTHDGVTSKLRTHCPLFCLYSKQEANKYLQMLLLQQWILDFCFQIIWGCWDGRGLVLCHNTSPHKSCNCHSNPAKTSEVLCLNLYPWKQHPARLLLRFLTEKFCFSSFVFAKKYKKVEIKVLNNSRYFAVLSHSTLPAAVGGCLTTQNIITWLNGRY